MIFIVHKMNLKLHKFSVLLTKSTWNTFYCLNNYTQILRLINDSCVNWNVTVYQNNSWRWSPCYLQNSNMNIFFMSCGQKNLVTCNKYTTGSFGRNMKFYYCTKNPNIGMNGGLWPGGNYCILQHGESCPVGMVCKI